MPKKFLVELNLEIEISDFNWFCASTEEARDKLINDTAFDLIQIIKREEMILYREDYYLI